MRYYLFTMDPSTICDQRNYLRSRVIAIRVSLVECHLGSDPIDQLGDSSLCVSHVGHKVVPEVYKAYKSHRKRVNGTSKSYGGG